MSEISITELEDKPEMVYLIGIGSDCPESVREWLFSDDFSHWWNDRFDHAGMLPVPAEAGVGKVLQMEEGEIKELMEKDE